MWIITQSPLYSAIVNYSKPKLLHICSPHCNTNFTWERIISIPGGLLTSHFVTEFIFTFQKQYYISSLQTFHHIYSKTMYTSYIQTLYVTVSLDSVCVLYWYRRWCFCLLYGTCFRCQKRISKPHILPLSHCVCINWEVTPMLGNTVCWEVTPVWKYWLLIALFLWGDTSVLDTQLVFMSFCILMFKDTTTTWNYILTIVFSFNDHVWCTLRVMRSVRYNLMNLWILHYSRILPYTDRARYD